MVKSLGAMLSGPCASVGSPMTNRFKVTGQTQSSSDDEKPLRSVMLSGARASAEPEEALLAHLSVDPSPAVEPSEVGAL